MQILSFHSGMAGRMSEALHRALQMVLFFLFVGVPLWSAEAHVVTTPCTTAADVGAVYEGTSELPHTQVPDCATTDSAADKLTRRYILYQHGMALEGWTPPRLGGTEAVYTSATGEDCRIVFKSGVEFHYCYYDILNQLAANGFTVISAIRPSAPSLATGGYVWTYAARVDEIVDYLKAQGVPSENIVVVGFSRGGVITQATSYLASDSALKFVSLAGCLTVDPRSVFYRNFKDETATYTIATTTTTDSDGVLDATRDTTVTVAAGTYPQGLRGMALNLVHADDDEGGACASDTTDVSFDVPTTGFQYDDVTCSDTGTDVTDCSGRIYTGHEMFYQADAVWIDKVVQWIDEPGGQFGFSASTYTVDEGAGSALITVQRTGFRTGGFSVDYATSDGTATAPADYAAASNTLTFGPGETSQTFTVSIVDDADVETSDTVNLSLSNATSGSSLGTTSSAVLAIANNDVAFRFSNPVYSVSEAGGDATITVVKLGGVPGTATVNYATSDGTATTAGLDYVAKSGTLTFAPTDPPTQTFTVTILNDSTPETTETVNLTLSSPTNTSGSASLATPTSAVLRILDDDANVRFSAATYTVSEADGTATITVGRLGAITSAVTVDYATSDGTAKTADSDYTAASGTLTFAAGVTTATFTVSITSDSVSEGDETVQLTLRNAVGATLVAPSTATLTITNANTPTGTNVAVQPVDSTTGTTPVSLTFASVTHGGDTTVMTTSSGTAPTSGFQLGNPPTYYEISTTATFSGSVTVCISYAGVSIDDEANLRLYHQESGAWVDVTTSLDTTNDIICGSVTSFSAFAIFEPIPLPVAIDIKPGSFPNSINLGSGGTVPVAIFSTSTFDARTLDPTTITLASAPVKLRGRGTPMASAEDVNGDGLPDLVVHVSTEVLQLHETDTEAVLKGKTFGGRAVKGRDTVRVVP